MIKKITFSGWLCIVFCFLLQGQDSTWLDKDTLRVEINAFGQYRMETQTLPSMHQLRGAALDRFNKTSFLQSLNTLPGVRMEERSPGSYRINMRGSSLRSPFGVRNVKVYYNGLPLTDAGGNTYFNQLAFQNVSSMEVAKGPAGSMYGAGTGGLILLNTLIPKQLGVEAEIMGGSFGLLNAMGTARWIENYKMQAAGISYTRQDGYRNQTSMYRANASYSGEWIKKGKFKLTGHLLAADLCYQTPGGLTLNEFKANPRAARPRVGALPSAQENKAAIYQQNFMAGITNKWQLANNWENETGFYGNYTQIRNPSIRNYEERKEPGWGGRTVFIHTKKSINFKQQWVSGGEMQGGNFSTQVFTNNLGQKGTRITNDDLNFFTGNIFTQINRQYGELWDITAGISYFQNIAAIKRKFPEGNAGLQKSFANDWAPRVSVIFRPTGKLQFSWLVSRGFSPPTVSELLPSTGIINSTLQPEYGWNYEGGMRLQSHNNKWSTGINFFRFELKDALVQRRDSTGADFYTNAGSTRQQGIEWNGGFLLSKPSGSSLQIIQVNGAYTYNNFKYRDYKQLENIFSGNTLPSVPAHVFSLTADIQLKNSFYFRSTFYAASSIWLNDANTAKADAYQLLGIKTGYGKKLQLFFGIDNLFNQNYSLGNDINAFGGRYFNAAPLRNFYSGINWKVGKK